MAVSMQALGVRKGRGKGLLSRKFGRKGRLLGRMKRVSKATIPQAGDPAPARSRRREGGAVPTRNMPAKSFARYFAKSAAVDAQTRRRSPDGASVPRCLSARPSLQRVLGSRSAGQSPVVQPRLRAAPVRATTDPGALPTGARGKRRVARVGQAPQRKRTAPGGAAVPSKPTAPPASTPTDEFMRVIALGAQPTEERRLLGDLFAELRGVHAHLNARNDALSQAIAGVERRQRGIETSNAQLQWSAMTAGGAAHPASKRRRPGRLTSLAKRVLLGGDDVRDLAPIPGPDVYATLDVHHGYLQWTCEHADPHFFLVGARGRLKAGWYQVEILLDTDRETGNAKLYCDFGQGFDEGNSFALPFRNGRTLRRLVRFSSEPRHVRFDPLDTAGQFVIKRLEFIRVSARYARQQMLDRIESQHPLYLSERSVKLAQIIRQESRYVGEPYDDHLIARYTETFVPNRQPWRLLSHPVKTTTQVVKRLVLGGGDILAFVPRPRGNVVPAERSPFPGVAWEAINQDPWLDLSGVQRQFVPGWYVTEMQMKTNVTAGLAKLYFDFGKGYSEDTSVTLPFKSDRMSKRVIWLPTRPRSVRFDPIETHGQFAIETLKFVRVSSRFAHQRMLSRIRSKHILFREQPVAAITRKLQTQAKKQQQSFQQCLLARYAETFTSHGVGRPVTYTDWILKHEIPELSNHAAIEAEQAAFVRRPLISIVMPVFNTGEEHLRAAIDSVIGQSYMNWELCIADDASPLLHVRRVLEEYRRRDKRIKVSFRAKNGHISAASNSALELASGEYIALLDHDDELAKNALHHIVKAINDKPTAKVLYTDEDKIDESGERSMPHFKSDWNPDLLYSQNYVSHLGVYSAELVRQVGGFRVGFEGSQDYDLLLRCVAKISAEQIVHIPKVLYHWRMVEGSTARASTEKRYTLDSGIKALEHHFAEIGQPMVEIEPGRAPNTYRVRWPIPSPPPLVSLLIPTRDGLGILKQCVNSILDKTTYENYEIIILDNQSQQRETLNWFASIQKNPKVSVVPYDQPFNFSAINNYGVSLANGSIIGLINNDIEVITEGWLDEMVSHACRPEVGCVGAKLYYGNGTLQHGGIIVGLGGVAGHSHKHFPCDHPGYFWRLHLIQNYSAITAACLLIRREVLDRIGPLNEADLSVAFNDVDLCMRAREAGYLNVWTPYAELFHHESVSRGAEDTPEKQARFAKEIDYMKRRWGDRLARDPYYNPNLTLDREDFTIG